MHGGAPTPKLPSSTSPSSPVTRLPQKTEVPGAEPHPHPHLGVTDKAQCSGPQRPQEEELGRLWWTIRLPGGGWQLLRAARWGKCVLGNYSGSLDWEG